MPFCSDTLFDAQHLLDLFRAVALLTKVPRSRFQQIEKIDQVLHLVTQLADSS